MSADTAGYHDQGFLAPSALEAVPAVTRLGPFLLAIAYPYPELFHGVSVDLEPAAFSDINVRFRARRWQNTKLRSTLKRWLPR
jgi:hypothetical protein